MSANVEGRRMKDEGTEPVNITVKWRTYGWFATCPQWPGESSPNAGPRGAAENLCERMWGKKPYRLTFKGGKGAGKIAGGGRWYVAQLIDVSHQKKAQVAA